MRFAHPWFLLLFLVLPLLLRVSRSKAASLRFSNLSALSGLPASLSVRFRRAMPFVRFSVLCALIIALARPQAGKSQKEFLTEGIDIVLVLDISGSMRAEDFAPQNRLGAAKQAASSFLGKREHDRIGLIAFAKHAMTSAPLTLDYGVLTRVLNEMEIGMIEDGTAIGTAIATAAKRLKDSPAKSKVMVLLTDGQNNAGELDPVTAAQAAEAFGIKIYAIGVGKPGFAPYPVDDPIFGRRYARLPTQLDEESLRKIADMTGGSYFRAKDSEGLMQIYREIDKLEKTEIEASEYVDYSEKSAWVLWPALVLLFLELSLRRTWVLDVP